MDVNQVLRVFDKLENLKDSLMKLMMIMSPSSYVSPQSHEFSSSYVFPQSHEFASSHVFPQSHESTPSSVSS